MEFREIEERGTVRRRWEDMDIDILVKIFHSLTVFELTSGIAHPGKYNIVVLSLQSVCERVPVDLYCSKWLKLVATSNRVPMKVLLIYILQKRGYCKFSELRSGGMWESCQVKPVNGGE
ncbi:hypothetical protein OIU74_017268 [Salix koriyanagi]|uniref:Uncharacterized protein n=1 Tax=Salix koriyanagi TaxID=2511006 RepID=A0A9Q0ST45_9ROSI|nr:hypothetical protein OIU74_017268 [Salix koriyanagi]